MLTYHIELRTADRVWETHTIERADVGALRIEMAQFVGELLRDHASKIWEDMDWRIDITDEEGVILYVIQIAATRSAATNAQLRA